MSMISVIGKQAAQRYCYLDTNLWNVLCDRSVDPEILVRSLANRNATLALGLWNVYEMMKAPPSRIVELFSYLGSFLEVNTPCVVEVMQIFGMEVRAVQGRLPKIDILLDPTDYEKLKQSAENLGSGRFDEQDDSFLGGMAAYSTKARSGQIGHIQERRDVKNKLCAVSPESLEQWLQVEALTNRGIGILADRVRLLFELPLGEAGELACSLLASPTYRVARGLVRADLYYNWRCANRGSVPKDLFHDMYHVLNAIYCDSYATKEAGQEEYAKLLLTTNTKVATYNDHTPIDQWLDTVA